MPETRVRSLGLEDTLERQWLPTPIFLPGEFPWTEEYSRFWGSMGLQRVGHIWVTNNFTLTHQALQCLRTSALADGSSSNAPLLNVQMATPSLPLNFWLKVTLSWRLSLTSLKFQRSLFSFILHLLSPKDLLPCIIWHLFLLSFIISIPQQLESMLCNSRIFVFFHHCITRALNCTYHGTGAQ